MIKPLSIGILMKGYKKIKIFQNEKKVESCGDFSLPDIVSEFKTPEEAKAFIQGVKWIVQYYDGEIIYEEHDLHVMDLDLSMRATNCCLRSGYEHLSDFEGKTKYDLTRMYNTGKKTMEEIINKCKKYGIIIE